MTSHGATRLLPVRPDLNELEREANELAGEHTALSDAQLDLAQRYGAENWPRLVQSCQLIDAKRTGEAVD